MKNKEILLKQYETLRNEILEANKSNNQILIVTVGFVGGVLSFCSSQVDEFYYGIISIYFVTFLAYRILYGNRKKIWRNASYMAVFIEPELKKIKWETRLNNLKTKMEPRRKSSFTSLSTENDFYIVNALNIIALVFLVFKYVDSGYFKSFADNYLELNFITYYISIILTITLFTWSFKCNKLNRRNGKNHQDFLDGWNEIKSAEKSKDN